MSIEKEFFNRIQPLANTPATRTMFAVQVNPTGGVIDLNTVFGPTGGAGHFYEVKAEGVPSGHAIHYAFATVPTYLIQPNNFALGATGGGHTGMGWPLVNGESIFGQVPNVGMERMPTLAAYGGTAGYATMFSATPNFLHFRGTPNMGTGSILRVRQASLVPGKSPADGPGGFPINY